MKSGPYRDTMNRFMGDSPSVRLRIVLESGTKICTVKSEPKLQVDEHHDDDGAASSDTDGDAPLSDRRQSGTSSASCTPSSPFMVISDTISSRSISPACSSSEQSLMKQYKENELLMQKGKGKRTHTKQGKEIRLKCAKVGGGGNTQILQKLVSNSEQANARMEDMINLQQE